MGADSKIEWTHHTFSPWWGCTKVSPGCAHCYADAFAKRVGQRVWGPDAPRRFFGDKHWAEPLRWDRAAAKAGERRRVFCASMADVFEARDDLHEPRSRLFSLILATPNLDWLLLTKRPENVEIIAPESWMDGFPKNVWLGTTVEDQQRADERVPHLLAVPAAVRFLSVEPLLGPVDISPWLGVERTERCSGCEDRGPGEDPDCPGHPGGGIDWVIVGGESGPGARSCEVAWIRDVVRQCREASVPVFVKQVGSSPRGGGDVGPDGIERCERWSSFTRPANAKGGDPQEWPSDLRVREFPREEVRRG